MADETTRRAHLTRTEEQKRQLASEVIDYLNEVLALDSGAIRSLFAQRVVVNEALAEHETTQVSAPQGLGSRRYSDVGVLGLLNGLVGVDADCWGYITAVYDGGLHDAGLLQRFELTRGR